MSDWATTVPLPCQQDSLWGLVTRAAAKDFKSVDSFSEAMMEWVAAMQDITVAKLKKYWKPSGIKVALQALAMTEEVFCRKLLPIIFQRALALSSEVKSLDGGQLPILRQGVAADVTLPRDLVASLVANMFLCTFPVAIPEDMNMVIFLHLFGTTEPQEVAKLAMIMHYFERIGTEHIPGQVIIHRVAGASQSLSDWKQCKEPLLPMKMAPRMVGFEEAPELAHVDFANRYIGGGVLTGGCVQEEIRFAICPENLVAILMCPAMEDNEAIQILGAEQFSKYTGYAFRLGYGGDYCDNITQRRSDGTVLTSILAIDALDFRHERDRSIKCQLREKNLVRELTKAQRGFTPVNDEALTNHPVVATGNWGCGAFLGCAPLKALLQWAAASACGRQLRYFPFNEHFGDELESLVNQLVAKGATVGMLIQCFEKLSNLPKDRLDFDNFLENASTLLLKASSEIDSPRQPGCCFSTGGTADMA
eukprot:CAMPEP_0206503754 /NCGR_PEP_ID=MMETSP0324_2-20121206/54968_1 /ASSEMBLY_ACC=CAM_ASM_000836 /TAXON_ID=2866 /ORGANISM="Crypthecodinium cohnii, Strain Seligo" /LENGTH=476 /DNA_ID=CAMNT_0053992573 /DNA_START=43 /DNA_END=1473 /DNA_ORIENTATION=+